jgi:3',5'-cyclic-AMP phosphodiesterase
MDSIMLSDADKLAEVLGGHAPVARILTGHLHRCTAAMFAGCLVTSAPSTDRQVFLELAPSSAWPSSMSRPGCSCTASTAQPR